MDSTTRLDVHASHRRWRRFPRRPVFTSLIALLSVGAAPPEVGRSAAVPAITQGARCQPARPPRPIVGASPLTLTAKVEVGFEHGCSQSEEIISVITDLKVAVAGNKVQLTIESFQSTGIGPSPGRYRQGERGFHHDATRWRWRYSGSAEQVQNKLILRLDQIETAVDRSGGITYAETKTAAAAKTITCSDATVGILPALITGGEKSAEQVPICTSAVLCQGLFDLVPIPFEPLKPIAPRVLVDDALTLLPGAGLSIDVRKFHSSDWTYFRRQPGN